MIRKGKGLGIPENLKNRCLFISGSAKVGWTVFCGKRNSNYNDDDEEIYKLFGDFLYKDLQLALKELSNYIKEEKGGRLR